MEVSTFTTANDYDSRHSPSHSHAQILQTNIRHCIGLQVTISILLLTVVGSVFDAFIFIISKGSNTIVGITASVVGVAQLFSLLPAAIVMDRHNRGVVARSSGVLHMVGLLSFAIGVYFSSVVVIIVGLILEAVAIEFSSSSSECIFLDSIDKNNRAAGIGKKSAAAYIGAALSNSLVLLFFIFSGNQWRLESCRTVLLLTTALCCPMIIISLWPIQDPRHFTMPTGSNDSHQRSDFNDEYQEHTQLRNPQEYYRFIQLDVDDSSSLKKPLRDQWSDGDGNATVLATGRAATTVVAIGSRSSQPNGLLTPSTIETEEPEEDVCKTLTGSKETDRSTGDSSELIDAHEDSIMGRLKGYQRLIPFNVVLGAFIRCLGGGMSTRFFNLFFINEFHFSPAQVTLIAIGVLICISFLIPVAVRIANLLGRGYSTLALNLAGFGLYLSLATVRTPWLFTLIHVARTGLQTANVSVETSMIVDTTRSKHRGKWLAVNSVLSVSWFTTAAIGGYVVDHYGYRSVFNITAWLYGLATLVLLPVALTFPKWMDAKQQNRRRQRLLH